LRLENSQINKRKNNKMTDKILKSKIVKAIQSDVSDFASPSVNCTFSDAVNWSIENAQDIDEVIDNIKADVDYFTRTLRAVERLSKTEASA